MTWQNNTTGMVSKHRQTKLRCTGCNHHRYNHFTPESYGYGDLHPEKEREEKPFCIGNVYGCHSMVVHQYTHPAAQSRGMCVATVCAFDVEAADSMDKYKACASFSITMHFHGGNERIFSIFHKCIKSSWPSFKMMGDASEKAEEKRKLQIEFISCYFFNIIHFEYGEYSNNHLYVPRNYFYHKCFYNKIHGTQRNEVLSATRKLTISYPFLSSLYDSKTISFMWNKSFDSFTDDSKDLIGMMENYRFIWDDWKIVMLLMLQIIHFNWEIMVLLFLFSFI